MQPKIDKHGGISREVVCPPPSDTIGGQNNPRFNVFKVLLKRYWCTKHAYIYFRLHYLYICQGVDALKANLLKKALRPVEVLYNTSFSQV